MEISKKNKNPHFSTIFSSLIWYIVFRTVIIADNWKKGSVGYILKNRNFNKYFSGSFFSAIGDAIFTITLAWYIVDVHNSGYVMGTILLLMGISRFILGLLGGVVVDMIGPKKVMIASDLLRSLVIAIIFVFFVLSTVPLWLLFLLAIVFGMVDAFYWPAAEAIKPKLVEKKYLSQANSSYFTMVKLINIFGPAIGGVLLSWYSFSFSMFLVLLSFLLSAILIYFINFDPKEEHNSQVKDEEVFKSFITNLLQGFTFLKTEKILIVLIISMFFANIGANGIMVVLPFLVEDLEFGAGGLGILLMSLALGSAIMGIALSIKSIKSPSLYYVLIGFFGQGIFFGIITWFDFLPYIAASLFIVGSFTALTGVFIPTLIQTVVPEHLMGRVGSVLMTVSMASTPLAHFVFGILTDIYGPSTMFLVAGIIEALVAVISLMYIKFSQLPFVVERKLSL